MKPGQTISVQVNGTRDGLKPNTPYVIRLDGSTGGGIAVTGTDERGDISVGIVLPPATPPGGHTIDVTGDNQAGEPVDVSQPIYVPVSDNDSDGDGIDNASDSCPATINGGEDSDRDGIDDSCDGYIGPAPTVPAGGSTAPGSVNGGGSGATSTSPTSSGLAPTETTVAASFTGGNTQLAAPVSRNLQPAAAATIKKGSVLGSKTNFAPVTRQIIKKPGGPRSAGKNIVVAQPPRLIHWLPWAIGAGLAWLLLLLIILVRYFSKPVYRQRRTEYI